MVNAPWLYHDATMVVEPLLNHGSFTSGLNIVQLLFIYQGTTMVITW